MRSTASPPLKSAGLFLLPLGMSFTIIIVALGIRVLLDLTGMVRSDWRLDAAYCALFAVVAITLLVENPHDFFGYASIVLCFYWGAKALIVFKRQSKR